METSTREKLPTFCALCISRCGAIATIENGAFKALEPDPSHPTGHALCIKGKVAPEIVAHAKRILHPLERTRPKGDRDPGWRRISWDEALAKTAERLRAIADAHGPEAVVFSAASPSTSAISDSIAWIQRLRRAFGSPNLCASLELCGWGRFFASMYTYGTSVPGVFLPDLEHAGCILFWGYNPAVARLAHATATNAALARGAKLVVVDPRRAGLAHRSTEWLRVRPGTDAALALAITHFMILRGWFDRAFVQRWTNAPFLVRSDNGRLLRESDLTSSGEPHRFIAWDEDAAAPIAFDPRSAAADASAPKLALFGRRVVQTTAGPLDCRPVFDHVAERCRALVDPSRDAGVEAITGVPVEAIERTARLLWEHRPVAFYTWSGIEQQGNATQIARAIGQLYALTGCIDAPGGNVRFPSVATAPVDGIELLSSAQKGKTIGLDKRPLGGARWEFVTSADLYTAALEGQPYRARGLVAFGSNLVMANADSARGRDALAALEFFVHADLFMNPTAELADIVLPVASAFEVEGLAVGFEISTAAQSLVQLRRPVVSPRGEARSDTEIVFALAVALGLGEHFWDGDVDAGLRHLLGPSAVTLERLRAEPRGLNVALEPEHRKFAHVVDGGGLRAFGTPSGTIELYSETLLEHGQPPLPTFDEPKVSPRSQPELAKRFPLVLTSSKGLWFCESQHRGIASLRRRSPDPELEIHPDAAAARGISAGDWVRIETPFATVRARALFNTSLEPGVVCGQHGWWEACDEIGAPGFDPFDSDGANYNLLIPHRPAEADAVSGSVPHRAYLCEVSLVSKP